MSHFVESVLEAFRPLLSRELFSVESSMHDPEVFGNAVVVLAGDNLRLRLVLDRGDTFAEAAGRSDPENWFPLQRMIRAVGAKSPPAEGLLTPNEAAEIVDRHYEALDTGLRDSDFDRTKRALAEMECLATKRLIDRTARAAK